jgi:hypothetical protein
MGAPVVSLCEGAEHQVLDVGPLPVFREGGRGGRGDGGGGGGGGTVGWVSMGRDQ